MGVGSDLISFPNKVNPKGIKDYDYFIEKYTNNEKLILEEVNIKEKIYPLGDLWYDIYSFTQSEMRVSENLSFLTQKPENLLRRIIQSCTLQKDFVLDFFAGIGTTAAVAQKLNRKWLSIEMADYIEEFYTDNGELKVGIKGRLKNVLHGDKNFVAINKPRRSHLSSDINWQGGGFFKYQYLEQYEDALDNIVFKENQKGNELFDDYLIKYFIDFETKDNPALLQIDKLKEPFSYKLNVNPEEVGETQEVIVDIPETFNYLLGLNVKKIKARIHNKNKYLFILGEKDNKDIAVVWRNYDDDWTEKDFLDDKNYIKSEIEQWMPSVIYVNGQSVLTLKFNKFEASIKYIEPEFKMLMG